MTNPLDEAIAAIGSRPIVKMTNEEIARVCNGKASLQEGNKLWQYVKQLHEAIAFLSMGRPAAEPGASPEGYSQAYADQMRTALLRIQGIAGEPHQQSNREVQLRNISCIASDSLLGIERKLCPCIHYCSDANAGQKPADCRGLPRHPQHPPQSRT